ncbi:MAG: hypothetical protein IK133_07155 [Clostridia bacterium]|nr:hypothetical protein [Clostridia bacterium]
MQTDSIIMQTLCAPCACRCRYCLLGWDGHLIGADYARSECVALRWFQWLREHRPEISFHFSYGFSMEHPDLVHVLEFLCSIDSVGAHYLQMDGMRMRDDMQLASLTTLLAEHGVEHLNFTFYGLPAYHDAFAARKGDYDLMLRTVRAALGNGLMVSAGIPLSHENASQAEALLSMLQNTGMENIRFFVPHSEGRGIVLEPIRFAQDDYDNLPESIRSRMNSSIYRSERAWLQSDELQEETHRSLLLSLTPENICRYEAEDPSVLIAEAEALDDTYYSAFPSVRALAEEYGNISNTRWYNLRDMKWHWRQRYLKQYPLELYDVCDERQTGSRRY